MNSQRDDLLLKSSVFPAGTLLDSYYDRDVTRLSDRGLASNMIGDRWSEISSEEISSWEGTERQLPNDSVLNIDRVFRLDDIPQIASIASRRKLQNPDFIISGRTDHEAVLMAIDAKFSIDTAKSPQVSAETLQALLDVGDLITDLLPGLPVGAKPRDGLFISPDVPLSHYVMTRTRGRLSVRVARDQVVLIPARPVPFLKPLEGSRLIGTLASRDGFRDEIRTNMLMAMYYFRLVRACYGSYADLTAPIFGAPTFSEGTDEDLEQKTIQIARSARTAWDVVVQWDAAAEQVRRQRETAYAAMPFPLANKEVRDRINLESELRGIDAPSVNSVRKRLGAWYRQQFDNRIGVVLPPIDDISGLVNQIHSIASEVYPLVPAAMDAILDDVFAAQSAKDLK